MSYVNLLVSQFVESTLHRRRMDIDNDGHGGERPFNPA